MSVTRFKIIGHRNFNPRLIDLLTSADYLSIVNKPIRAVVEEVLENPQELWEKPYRTQISEEGRALMVALFFNNRRTGIPALERTFGRMVDAMGFAIPRADRPVRFRSALKELEGSVLAIQERQVWFSNPGVRDFLQRAIEEDRFLPAAINSVTEYAEVNQCWMFFCAQKPEPAAGHPASKNWSRAAARLLSSGSGTLLERLQLIIGMYDWLQDEAFLQHVRSAVGDLEAGELDGDEVDRCREVLDQLVLSILPLSELDEAKRVVSAAVAKMLVDYAGALSLDDIESVAFTLCEYGWDQGAAGDVAREALSAYISGIGSTLSEINSLDELDRFARELRRVMGDFGLADSRADRDIEYRRERLIEGEEHDNAEGYGRSASLSQPQFSDDQIRSMFHGLLGR